jgi:hypothetical protein
LSVVKKSLLEASAVGRLEDEESRALSLTEAILTTPVGSIEKTASLDDGLAVMLEREEVELAGEVEVTVATCTEVMTDVCIATLVTTEVCVVRAVRVAVLTTRVVDVKTSSSSSVVTLGSSRAKEGLSSVAELE